MTQRLFTLNACLTNMARTAGMPQQFNTQTCRLLPFFPIPPKRKPDLVNPPMRKWCRRGREILHPLAELMMNQITVTLTAIARLRQDLMVNSEGHTASLTRPDWGPHTASARTASEGEQSWCQEGMQYAKGAYCRISGRLHKANARTTMPLEDTALPSSRYKVLSINIRLLQV